LAAGAEEFHAPVDADELAGLQWEPDVFALDYFAREDEVVDVTALGGGFAFW
jgi:hypothetical protein